MTRPRRPGLLGPVALVLTMSAACKPQGELAICEAQVADERAEESDTRRLPPWRWFQVLVPRMTLKLPEVLAPDDPKTCANSSIGITWADPERAALDPRSRAEALPPRPLTDADLTFAEAPGDQYLIWARIRHFSDGSALGPVALARWVDRGVEIRGIGTLWMHAERPRLRLEALGDDAQVLVADAMKCPTNPATPGERCSREVHLLPLIRQRFVEAELFEDGTLVGPTRFSTLEHASFEGRGGWVKQATVKRLIQFKAGKIMVAESILVRECDPKTEMAECGSEKGSSDARALEWDPKNQRFSIERGTWRRMTAG